MKKVIITLLATTAVAMATAAEDTEKALVAFKEAAHEAIRSDAFEKWGDDYVMIEYQIKRQKQAFASYLLILEAVSPKNPKPDVKRAYDKARAMLLKHEKKWGSDYVMVLYSYDREMKAFLNLHKD